MVLVVAALLNLVILQFSTLMIKHQLTAVDVVYGQYQPIQPVQFLKYGAQAATAVVHVAVCREAAQVAALMLLKPAQ
jgi:thiosulfate reductase cytochrome b subunit